MTQFDERSINMDEFIYLIEKNVQVKNDWNIVEIGSLNGDDASKLQKHFGLKTYAIEASRKHYVNVCKHNNITPINAIISDKTKVVEWYEKNIDGISSIYNRGDEYEGSIEENQISVNMKNICKDYNISSIDILKIDVEGATLDVLQGMEDYLNTVKIMHIETESHELFKGQKGLHKDVYNFLCEKGFLMKKMTSCEIYPDKFQYDSVWIKV